MSSDYIASHDQHVEGRVLENFVTFVVCAKLTLATEAHRE